MVDEGEQAPDFQISGVVDDNREQFRLHRRSEQGNVVLLLFYPFDFSPICTRQLCTMRNAGWFDEFDALDVWGISSDSTYAHRAFAEQYDIEFPLLSDDRGEVASRYDVKYDWWDGHVDVPKRAVFVVDTDGSIAYRWQTDDAYTHPNYWVVQEALESVAERFDGDVQPVEQSPSAFEKRLEARLE